MRGLWRRGAATTSEQLRLCAGRRALPAPNCVSFSVAIRACGEAARADDALRLLDGMRLGKGGMVDDARLRACFGAASTVVARQRWFEPRAREVHPDAEDLLQEPQRLGAVDRVLDVQQLEERREP